MADAPDDRRGAGLTVVLNALLLNFDRRKFDRVEFRLMKHRRPLVPPKVSG
jgi:hypothetical protein